MKNLLVEIYTDGSCWPNPDGYGGWCFVLRYPVEEGQVPIRFPLEIGTGSEEHTTTNRMELRAISEAILHVRSKTQWPGNTQDVEIHLYTDSSYAKHALTDWAIKWKTNGWTNSLGEPVNNQDLIKSTLAGLSALRRRGMPVQFHKVKGHSVNPWNNMADRFAGGERVKITHQGLRK